MRKSLLSFALAVALASCSTGNDAGLSRLSVLEVSLEDETRTSMGASEDGFRKLFWSEGDRIAAGSLVSDALSAQSAGSRSAQFIFSEPLSAPLTVLYPAEFYKDAATITLPQLQTYVEGSFASNTNPCAAYAEDLSSGVTLQHLCAIICVKLQKGTHEHPIKGVIFKGGADEKVAGDFSIDYRTATLTPAAGALSILKLATGSLSLAETPAELYFVVPAGHYEGFSFRIVDSENHYMDASKKSAVDLLPGRVYTLDEALTYAPTGTLVDAGMGDFTATGTVVQKIASAAEWNSFAADYNAGKFSSVDPGVFSVQLTEDLDFSACSSEFVTINVFSGGMEGQGHKITNLAASGPLFGTLDNASVTDLHIDASCSFNDFSSDSFGPIASVVSGMQRNNIIESCSCDAVISTTAAVAGGLFGALESGALMRYCTFKGSITSSGTVGGLVGSLGDCDMDDCINYGNVTCPADGRSGGIIGVVESPSCIVTGGGNYGKVITAASKHGLLVGEFSNLSSLSGAFVGGACYTYAEDGNHLRHSVSETNWLTEHTGYGYSSVASKISGLTSSFGAGSELTLKDAELRILFIGNSFTDDAVKHLPGMIAAAGLSSKITIAHMYYGGRIMQEYNDWTKSDYTLNKFEAGAATSTWTTHSSKVSIAEVAACGRWDIITMQEHTGNFHGWTWDSTEKSYFEGMFSKLSATQQKEPSYYYILSQAYYDMNKIGPASRPYMTWPLESTRSAQLAMYDVIVDYGKKVMNDMPFDGVLATGTALQNLRTSKLNNSMDLTRDGYHMDYGISRYSAACLLFESLITPKFGVKVDDFSYRYSNASTVSGSYSTPVTDINAPIALEAARYAMASPFVITDMNPGAQTKVSIIGDSISTFKGWLDATSVDGKTCTTHYPNTSNSACDVSTVDKTWWYRLIYGKMRNGVLESNISSGNTTVVQNTTATNYATQYWYNWDFCTRLQKLGVGNPDVIFIHGGTNDLGHIKSYGASECLIGTQAMNSSEAPDADLLQNLFATADAATTLTAAEALDFSTFCSAYIKLLQMIKVRYPDAKVVCIIGDCVSAGMQSAIKSIAEHYGAKNVDLLAINGYRGTSPISKYDGAVHPDAAGMAYMADEIFSQVGTWIE